MSPPERQSPPALKVAKKPNENDDWDSNQGSRKPRWGVSERMFGFGFQIGERQDLLRESESCDFAKAFFNLDTDCTPSGIAGGQERRAASAERIEHIPALRRVASENFRDSAKRFLICVKLRRNILAFDDVTDRG